MLILEKITIFHSVSFEAWGGCLASPMLLRMLQHSFMFNFFSRSPPFRQKRRNNSLAMADEDHFSLCWNNFGSNLSTGFHESLLRGDLVDVTLVAEGQMVKAHRLVLSVCSPLFRDMFATMPANQHAFGKLSALVVYLANSLCF